MDRGVSGFRIDAVPFLFEVKPDEDRQFPDEPHSGDTNDPDDYGYLRHIFTSDQPETIDMVIDNYYNNKIYTVITVIVINIFF